MISSWWTSSAARWRRCVPTQWAKTTTAAARATRMTTTRSDRGCCRCRTVSSSRCFGTRSPTARAPSCSRRPRRSSAIRSTRGADEGRRAHRAGAPPRSPRLFRPPLRRSAAPRAPALPHGSAPPPAAAAAAAADVAGVGLHLAPAQYTHGAKAGGTAVVAAAAPAAAASPRRPTAPRRKLAAAASARPAARGGDSLGASFFTVGVGELFELGAPPAAAGRARRRRRRRRHSTVLEVADAAAPRGAVEELLALHGRHNDFPPLDGTLTPAAAASQVGAARAWRRSANGAPTTLRSRVAAPRRAPRAARAGRRGDGGRRRRDAAAPRDRSVRPTAARRRCLRRAALLLSGAAAQADGCAETVGPPGSIHALHRGPDGEHDTSGLGRATAMCSALALCVGAAAAAATTPPAADGAARPRHRRRNDPGAADGGVTTRRCVSLALLRRRSVRSRASANAGGAGGRRQAARPSASS